MANLLALLETPRTQAALVFLIGYIYICSAKRFRAAALWVGVVILLLLGAYRPEAGEAGLLRGA
ncbi:MAG: hypothetical protein ABIF82_07860, partial [Planctomycetota bacterium]